MVENLSPRHAPRRLLIDALMVCLERSKVCNVIESRTIRFALDSARGVVSADGAFRLDPVWKILCQQPELTAREVAAPLLVLKSYESVLGARVALPEELTVIPEAEQQELRSQLNLSRADFERALAQLKERPVEREVMSDVDAGARRRATGPEMPAATSYSEQFSPAAQAKSAGTKARALAALLGVLTLVAVGIGVVLTLPSRPEGFDLARASAILTLADGKRIDASLTARIVDPKWDSLKREEQQKLADEIFHLVATGGIKALTLIDRSDHIRVQALESQGNRRVHVH
jgi:hypothetical protein